MQLTTDVIDWLNALPENSTVYIDEGGLALRCFEDPEFYFELGGAPED